MSGAVVDLVYDVEHLPAPGEEVESQRNFFTTGGGFNAMVAAKRFGIKVFYGGSIGTGLFADVVVRDLQRQSIGAVLPSRQLIDQGTCVVLIDKTGERSFISHHGAERRIDPTELALIDVSRFDWVLLTGYSLFKKESARAFLPWLKSLQRSPLFLFDPGPTVAHIAPDVLNVALARADWISANGDEAKIITGFSDPALASQSLARTRRGAMVRVGADGCYLSLAGEVAQHISGFTVDTIDTNGAGDAHDGAFIAGICRGFNPSDAAQLANVAAALSTTKQGPAEAPSLEETQAFLATRGIILRPNQAKCAGKT